MYIHFYRKILPSVDDAVVKVVAGAMLLDTKGVVSPSKYKQTCLSLASLNTHTATVSEDLRTNHLYQWLPI